MQMESFPNFRKLWGRIDNPLTAGNYLLKINNSKLLQYNII